MAAALSLLLALGASLLLRIHDGQEINIFFLTLACTWAVLIPAKIWTKPVEDSWMRRSVLLALGSLVGFEAIWLEGYQLRAVASDLRPEFFGPREPREREAARASAPESRLSRPASYLAFFALAFFATRWWRLTDRNRPRRVRLGPVFGAVFWGFVLTALLPALRMQSNHGAATWQSPGAGFVALVSAAIIIQWVSPWAPRSPVPCRRLRLRLGGEAGP
jgi:hypothetical protein